MQIDMHMFGTYTLARAAGINDRTARTIAITSQFVDESVHDDNIVVSNQYAILPTMTSHSMLDFQNMAQNGQQWHVWVPFHFLPGNESTTGTFIERLTCRKNSKIAQKMVQDALDESNRNLWPHLIGITAHVYADTFSHFGFSGISSKSNLVADVKLNNPVHSLTEELNKVAGKFAGIIPMGHGTASVFPDIPFLSWDLKHEGDTPQQRTAIKRNNAADFLDASRELHNFFTQYAAKDTTITDPQTKRNWADIEKNVNQILNTPNEDTDARSNLWKKAINDGIFFQPTKFDQGITYDPHQWDVKNLFTGVSVQQDQAKSFHACKFLRAAHHHRHHVVHQLLPSFGLLVP
ncbi:MAG: DUF6765 family protein [Candidatus Omnitrophota bacterium]